MSLSDFVAAVGEGEFGGDIAVHTVGIAAEKGHFVGGCFSQILAQRVVELTGNGAEGKVTCVGSLREACEKLPQSRFYRSHRSFIVNLGRVKRIERYQFTMDNGDAVAVAKNRYAEAKKAWRTYCG